MENLLEQEIEVLDQSIDLVESAQPEFFGSFFNSNQVKFNDQEVVNEVFDCLSELKEYQLGIRKTFDLKSIQTAISLLQIIDKRAE